jgi:CxxC-x17-CxxC domain-containing protein
MYTVTCADCGAETTVPFEPREGRPVYCRDCYAKQRQSGQA